MVSRRKKKKQARKARRLSGKPSAEDRRSVAITVAWMLTLMATLLFTTIAAGSALLAGSSDTEPSKPLFAMILAEYLWFTSLVTGTVCLLLIPLVYRFRPTPPPLPITLAAVIVGLAPWLVVLGRW